DPPNDVRAMPPSPKVGSSSPLAATAEVAKNVSTSATRNAPRVVERIALPLVSVEAPDGRNARRLGAALTLLRAIWQGISEACLAGRCSSPRSTPRGAAGSPEAHLPKARRKAWHLSDRSSEPGSSTWRGPAPSLHATAMVGR